MAQLTVATWLWGEKYGAADVHKLFAGVGRNLSIPHRKLLVTDRAIEIEGVEVTPVPERARYLLDIPGCMARLVAFDPEWQAEVGIEGAFLNLDLDMVITRSIDHIANVEEPFSILRGINGTNPCPYNGSVWRAQAGYRPDVWSEFTVEKSRTVPFHSFPDDQAWFYDRMPDCKGYGPKTGVYGFRKNGWPGTEESPLPENACIVAFPGFRSPSQFTHLRWVKEHWRE